MWVRDLTAPRMFLEETMFWQSKKEPASTDSALLVVVFVVLVLVWVL